MYIIEDRNKLVETYMKLQEKDNDDYITKLSHRISTLLNIDINKARTNKHFIFFDFNKTEFRIDVDYKNKKVILTDITNKQKIITINSTNIDKVGQQIKNVLEEKFYSNKYALLYLFVYENNTESFYYSTVNEYGFTKNKNEAYTDTKENMLTLKEEIFNDANIIKLIKNEYCKLKNINFNKVSLEKDLTKVICLR